MNMPRTYKQYLEFSDVHNQLKRVSLSLKAAETLAELVPLDNDIKHVCAGLISYSRQRTLELETSLNSLAERINR